MSINFDQFFDFFNKYGFVFEMTVCNYMFSHTLERKKKFFLRVLLCIFLFFVLSFFWSFFYTRYSLWDILKYTLFFLLAVESLHFCFKINRWASLFIEIGAYATQHCGYKVGELLQFLFKGNLNVFFYSFLYISSIAIVYLIFYFVFAKRIKKYDIAELEDKQVILLSIALLLFTIIFGQYDYINLLSFYLIVALYDIMCCVFTLCLQYGLLQSAKLKQDYNLMQHILHMQQQKFIISKENMDIINIKCHDLKHFISRFGDRISPDELNELNQLLSIYDMSLKTGNESLDIILAEKSLLCRQLNIKINCIVDGKALSFMRASDIYSLFGNAIDNAIDAVKLIEDPAERIISIKVKKTMGMVSINFENSYKGQLDFEQGLPKTTKEDKRYHGFGMKSIKIITERYNGYLSVNTQNGIFILNILLPDQNTINN